MVHTSNPGIQGLKQNNYLEFKDSMSHMMSIISEMAT